MYAGNRVFHFPPLFLSFLSRTRPFFLFERARVLSFFPALKARLLRKRKKEFVPPSDHGDSHSLPVIPVCQRVPPRYKCWDEAKGPPFLLAVWKNASTNMNHGIFVQLFCDLLDIYFMLYALCLCSWSQLVSTMSSQLSNVRRWSKSCTECEIEMILKRGLRQDESRRGAKSTDLN